ncbi:MAG: hypothetical protein AAF551_15245 [Bacteroidota bacterium]
MYYRGCDTRTEILGGMAATIIDEIITKGEEKQTYVVIHREKVVNKILMEEDGEELPKPVVTKEDEAIDILGYQCQKYKVVTLTEETTFTQYV